MFGGHLSRSLDQLLEPLETGAELSGTTARLREHPRDCLSEVFWTPCEGVRDLDRALLVYEVPFVEGEQRLYQTCRAPEQAAVDVEDVAALRRFSAGG